MELSAKLKAVRLQEGLTQMQLCDLLGFSLSTYKKYELGLAEMGSPALLKVTQNERFKKYVLWLMTDDVAPECGQISPI